MTFASFRLPRLADLELALDQQVEVELPVEAELPVEVATLSAVVSPMAVVPCSQFLASEEVDVIDSQ